MSVLEVLCDWAGGCTPNNRTRELRSGTNRSLAYRPSRIVVPVRLPCLEGITVVFYHSARREVMAWHIKLSLIYVPQTVV